MTVKIEESTRAQVAVFVPKALQKAVASYHDFMDMEIETGAKKFAEHHTAGKVALGHIQLLLKLAEWAKVEPGVHAAIISELLRHGVNSVNDHNGKKFTDDDFEQETE